MLLRARLRALLALDRRRRGHIFGSAVSCQRQSAGRHHAAHDRPRLDRRAADLAGRGERRLLGAQVRYWQLGDQRHRFDITDVQPDTVFDGTQSLTMYDIDAELTKRWNSECWGLAGSFGGRYGSLERLVTATGFGTTAPADSFAFIFDNRTSAGGITGSIELSRRLGDSSWEVFGCFRASELWGETSALFDSRDNTGGTPSIQNQSAQFDSNLTIWEAQTGLQCSKHVDCCNATVLARCAFEYQSWNWSVPGGTLRAARYSIPASNCTAWRLPSDLRA